jgi:hypothetical protein
MLKVVRDHPLVLGRRAANHMAALAEELSLPPFTLLLVGDGSGSVYAEPAGWCCAAYDAVRHRVYVHAGAVTGGSTNFAELMPYLQALYFHHSQEVKARKEDRYRDLIDHTVCVLSDSEVTVRCGQGRYARRANGFLWEAIGWFERNGYSLTWQHVRRGSNEWNAFADAVGQEARRQMAEFTPAVLKQLKRRFHDDGPAHLET